MALTAAASRLMKNVAMRVPGALDAAKQQEAFAVLNEFFQDSNIWQTDISIPIVSLTVASYVISPAAGSMFNRLLWVKDSGLASIPATMQVPGTVVLVSAPSKLDTYTATLALTVVDPPTGDNFPNCPDWIISKYADGLLDGILGRLMSQPAKPYTNERMSIYHLRRFRVAVALARAEWQHGNVFRAQSWVYPRGWSVPRRRG